MLMTVESKYSGGEPKKLNELKNFHNQNGLSLLCIILLNSDSENSLFPLKMIDVNSISLEED